MFHGFGAWHPMLASVKGDGERPGALRIAKRPGGEQQVEHLIEIDDAQHFYRYEMLLPPMEVSKYVACFPAKGIRLRRKRAVWVRSDTHFATRG